MRSLTLSLALSLIAWTSAHAKTTEDMIERARGIHQRVITIDTHVDIPPNFATPAYDLMKPGPSRQRSTFQQ